MGHARGVLRHRDQAPDGEQPPARRSLAELLAESDFVTLHVPATPQTHEMIGARELAMMKRGALPPQREPRHGRGDRARSPSALRERHRRRRGGRRLSRRARGRTSDAFATELRGLPNVILTPHIGGSTEEAQEAIGREVATALVKFVERRAPRRAR